MSVGRALWFVGRDDGLCDDGLSDTVVLFGQILSFFLSANSLHKYALDNLDSYRTPMK
jgi:hypothetical protein